MSKRLVLARYRYVNSTEHLTNGPSTKGSHVVQKLDKNIPVIIHEISEQIYLCLINTGYTQTVPVLDDLTRIRGLRVVDSDFISELHSCLDVVMGEYIRICDELEKIRIQYVGSESHNGICEGANKIEKFKKELNEAMKMIELYNTFLTEPNHTGFLYRLSLED